MNRKLIGAVAFTAVVAGGYLAHNIQKQSDEQLSDLMIENIEALADGEDGEDKGEKDDQLSIACQTRLKYVGGTRMNTDCKSCSFKFGYIPDELNKTERCIPG